MVEADARRQSKPVVSAIADPSSDHA